MNKVENKPKIKIIDNNDIRQQLISIINDQNSTLISKWAINNVLRVLELLKYDMINSEIINKGIESNNLCNRQLITIKQLREVGFEIHRCAKKEEDIILKSALRAFGHAVSTAHMKEHAIISSDYLIKTINLLFDNDASMALKERKRQLNELAKIICEDHEI